jgi:hypothetical protein
MHDSSDLERYVHSLIKKRVNFHLVQVNRPCGHQLISEDKSSGNDILHAHG